MRCAHSTAVCPADRPLRSLAAPIAAVSHRPDSGTSADTANVSRAEEPIDACLDNIPALGPPLSSLAGFGAYNAWQAARRARPMHSTNGVTVDGLGFELKWNKEAAILMDGFRVSGGRGGESEEESRSAERRALEAGIRAPSEESTGRCADSTAHRA
jgi:hypothetical protein